MPFFTFSATILGAFFISYSASGQDRDRNFVKKNRNRLKISNKMAAALFLRFPKPGRGSFATHYYKIQPFHAIIGLLCFKNRLFRPIKIFLGTPVCIFHHDLLIHTLDIVRNYLKSLFSMGFLPFFTCFRPLAKIELAALFNRKESSWKLLLRPQ